MHQHRLRRAAEQPAGERIGGRAADGEWVEVQIAPDGCAAANPAFDVTPAALVSALITERGVVPAQPDALRALAEQAP